MSGNGVIKVDLGAVEETLLLPLWARAVESKKDSPIVRDTYAASIVDRIDYDFSKIESGQVAKHQIVYAIRAHNFDRIVRAFLSDHPSAVVVNIGAGLDTTFQRVDDGQVQWVNIDVPRVAGLRERLVPDTEREMTAARSVFDYRWMDEAEPRMRGRSVMFIAGGVLCYFQAEEVGRLFRKLARVYPSAHVVFDSFSRFTAWGTNRSILRDSGMSPSARIRWHLKRASELRRWVDTLEVMEEYPMLSKLPRQNGLSTRTLLALHLVGLFRLYNMIHVRL